MADENGGLQTCTLVFLRRGDEILLAMKKRGFGKGRWNGAGGKVEPGETIEQAMVREAQEEIGVTPLRFRKVAANRFHGTGAGGKVWGNVGHTYICEEWRGEPSETEEMAPRWFELANIPYHEMWEDDALWLPLVLAGKYLRTDFAFDEHDHMRSAHIDILAPDEL